MEKPRLRAYLNLIQKMLTCPYGEEWIHLKQHEDLVDADFLQFMEQIALQIDREGDHNSATFLHNWAAKLHHILLKEIKPTAPEEDRSDAYLDLIQQLLACPEGKEEQLLIAHETLIGPGLVNKINEVAKQLYRQGEEASAQYLASIAKELSQAWLQEHDFSAQLQKAPVHRTPAPYARAYSAASSAPPASSEPLPLPVDEPVDELDNPWFSSEDTDSAPDFPSPPSPVQAPPKQTKPLPGLDVEHVPEVSPVKDAAAPMAIAEGLQAIAQALQQINHTLALQRSPSSLQHLAMLEQACAAQWQLTTEEVELLLGVRPHCPPHETTYQRGEWCFTKVGKLGSQTAWQVTKVNKQLDDRTA